MYNFNQDNFSKLISQRSKTQVINVKNQKELKNYFKKIMKKDIRIYGKTGTAQICSNCDLLPHAWFAGFIELNKNKKVSVVVMIENGGKGSNKSTIMAKKIFQYLIDNNV